MKAKPKPKAAKAKPERERQPAQPWYVRMDQAVQNALLARADWIAAAVIAASFFYCLHLAGALYLNNDECIHYIDASRPNVWQVFQATLHNAHPPLFYLLLHFWLFLGSSEVWLRMLPTLGACLFLWFTYKWMGEAFGKAAGLATVLLAAFAPALNLLAVQVRNYTTLLGWAGGALYFLDKGLRTHSRRHLWIGFGFLYAAINTHYSAAMLTLGIGLYTLARLMADRPPRSIVLSWIYGNAGAAAWYALWYAVHLSRIKDTGMRRGAVEGWLSEQFPRQGQDALEFVMKNTEAVFVHLAASETGALAGLGLFFAGLALLAWRKTWRPALPLVLAPFLAGILLALAKVHPYGNRRHAIYLLAPAVVPIGFVVAKALRDRAALVLAAAAVAIPYWQEHRDLAAAGIVDRYYIADRTLDRQRGQMTAAFDSFRASAKPGALLLTDYASSLTAAYYLSPGNFTPETCTSDDYCRGDFGGYRVRFLRRWNWAWDPTDLVKDLERLRKEENVPRDQWIDVLTTQHGVNLLQATASQYPQVSIGDIRTFGPLIVFCRIR